MTDQPQQFATINPASGETLSIFSYHRPDQVEKILSEAWAIHGRLKSLPLPERADLLGKMADSLSAQTADLARLMSLEMGKPIKEARAEIAKSVEALRLVARQEVAWPQTQVLQNGPQTYEVRAAPVGVLLAIMPWNFPVWQVVRVLAPAVLLGNAVVLKHADLVAGTAELLAKVLSEVNPVLLNLRLHHSDIEGVIADSRVRGVTLTGSVRAGSAVAALAGKHLKKSVLELGGADPYLVFQDADLKKAARLCAVSRMINGGQSCIAAKRFFVHESLFKDFLEGFTAVLGQYRFNNPLLEDTQVGPLASQRHCDAVQDQVVSALSEGLKLHWKRDHGMERGAYSSQFVLTGTGHEAVFMNEEFFGPVALVAPFREEAEVIQMCNQSIYGLGGAIFTEDRERFFRLASQIESGMLAWNDFLRSDARFPFGGVKCSGYGRELGREGLAEFAFTQTLIL